jgi:hypothetical protein
MLFSYTDDSFKSVANGGKISVPGTNDPYDLIFRDSTSAQLDHEIEKYDPATGEVRAWVRVPSITDGTVLYVYYGNSSITASTQNKTGVWDSDYKGVWHLKESAGGSGAIKDSTSNANNGTTTGTLGYEQTGQIGSAVKFNQDGDQASNNSGATKTEAVSFGDSPFDITSTITVSGWIKQNSWNCSVTVSTPTERGFMKGDGSTDVWGFDRYDRCAVRFYLFNSSSDYKGAAYWWTDSTWTYFVGTYDGSYVRLYVNGAQQASDTQTGSIKTNNSNLVLGNKDSAAAAQTWRGWFDEFRVSNSARSAGWIHTEFHNQGSPSTFFTLGSETAISAPTAVTLKSFAAREYNGAVLLQWETGYEVDNLGFHLYREENGKLSRLTPEPVAGSSFLAGAGIAVIADRSYQWWDYPAMGGERSGASIRYWLEDLDLNGKRTLHGPVTASLSQEPLPALANSELLSALEQQANGAPYVQTVDPAPGAAAGRWLEETPRAGPGGRGLRHKAALPAQKFLAGQPAVKILVKEPGWYRVSQPELVAAGMNPRVDPQRLQLYVDGRKQAMRVAGQNDRRFGPQDAIEFYGEGLDTPATDTRVYWLVEEPGPGTRIEEHRGQGGFSGPASFAHTVERKDRVIYFAPLKNGEASNFFGPVVSPDPVDQILTLRHMDPAPPGPASLEVVLQGSTQVPHRVQVAVNEKKVGEVVFEGRTQGRLRVEVPQSLLHEGYNKVSLTAQAGESDYSLIEAIRLSYWHTYAADGDALKFTAPGGRKVSVAGFSQPGVQVFDVTDPHAVVEAAGRVKAGAVSFRVPGSGERTLYALSREKVKKAQGLVANKPSSWTRSAPGYDLVMISHADFMQSLVPLKGLRESQGLSVALIDVADLYDELNFGHKSPQALEDFLVLAASTWRKPPRFALLVGDASLDPRNYLGFGSRDFVPTKLIDTRYLETASDDALADLDGAGLAEIAIGRLPVGTRAEAEAVVAKILRYERAGATKPVALLVADSEGEEAYDFEAASEAVAALLPRTVAVQRIFRDQYAGDDAAREALLSRIREGPLLVNYNGHGSVEEWRGDLLTTDLAENLVNTRLPFFVNMTCLNGFFQDVYSQTLGEALLKAPRGGAIAVWGSSGLTDPEPQVLMNKELIRLLFGGASLTIGEAVQRAKAATADLDVRRTWILFGDPATRLK